MALTSSSSGARNENISDYINDNIVASMNVKQKKYVAPHLIIHPRGDEES